MRKAHQMYASRKSNLSAHAIGLIGFALLLLASCKKQGLEIAPEQSAIGAIKPITNGVPPPYGDPQPLIDMGNGVYQVNYNDYQGFQLPIQLSNLTYKVTDDYGNPMGAMVGNPVFGTVSTLPNTGVVSVAEQPANTASSNQFAVSIGYSSGLSGLFNSSQYENDVLAAASSYQTALTNWQTIYQNGGTMLAPPKLVYPKISNYINENAQSSGVHIMTGKIIRVKTGSTFAVVPVAWEAPPPSTASTNSNVSTSIVGVKSNFNSAGLQLRMYAPTSSLYIGGPVTNISIIGYQDYHSVVSDFYLSFNYDANQEGWHASGTITLNDGTQIQINDWMYI